MGGDDPDREGLVIGVHEHRVTLPDLTGEQLHGERVLDLALDGLDRLVAPSDRLLAGARRARPAI